MRNRILLLILLFCSSSHLTLSRSQQHLERGESLSVEDASDFITSPDKSFTCGFYGLGSNAYWFGIWFTDSRDRTVVWMANRDRPVNGRGAKVSLWGNGALVLTDIDGTTIWQTDATSTDVAAELLNTGNLVLKNSQGKFLWQSFDYPTDTLLPWQALTKNKSLVSSLRKGSYEPGYFSLYFDSDNILKMIYNGPDVSSIYWPNPDDVYHNGRTAYNSSRIAVLDDMGRFRSSDQLQFSAADAGLVIKRRLAIDYDGNLRIYSLNRSTGLWNVSWQATIEQCKVHGQCGENAICVYAPEPKCSCPLGYEVRDPNDQTEGCKAKFNKSLLNSQQVKFVELPKTDYWGFDLNYTERTSFTECKKRCSNDSQCTAFGYRLDGKGQCFTKGKLLNGIKTPNFPGSIYLKLPTSVQTSEPKILKVSDTKCPSGEPEDLVGSPSMYHLTNKRVIWAHLYSFGLALGVIECMLIIFGWWFLFQRHGVPAFIEDGYHILWSQFKRFSYGELKKATNNFKEELGRGGSGVVYKGLLEDERIVAVKRLGDVSQAEEEFWAEMSTIGRIYHMNLVRMWGFCSEKKHRLLVYEYVENSSLDKHLFTSNFLPWKQRFEVALGTAKGLAYLHHECLEWVIHCDVKPENILLDAKFQPKIADFGVAKLSQRGGSGSGVSQVRGTIGYMAPEWTLNQPITAKVDVYGYGVVVLEIVKGTRLSNLAIDDTDEQEAQLMKFVKIVKRNIESREDSSWVESAVDSRLEGKYCRDQAAKLIEIGVACVDEDRNKRPTMASVVQMLLECEGEPIVRNPDEE